MNKTKLTRGVGIYEKGTYKVTIDGRMTREYALWNHMLQRCDPNSHHRIRNTSYEGCSIHQNFINYQWFGEWCQTQIGFDHSDWQLDKDILVTGNKVYGPDTCVFVPSTVNMLFTYKQKNLGGYPPGVCAYPRYGKYKAAIGIDGKTKTLGYFDTPEAAHEAYKVAKLADIARHAEIWKGRIDPRVYQAMINHRFDSK
jgi:hypothetical protein